MRHKKKIISAISFLFFPLFFVFPVQAQEIDCSGYYNFQSVQFNVGPDKGAYIPQESVVFKGTLENQNNYPIVDGSVFVRISQKNPNSEKEGNFIIDEFFALENIFLEANAKKDVTFSWKMPDHIIGGDYRADYFFSVGKQFSLEGLPYSEKNLGGFSEFKIDSPSKEVFQLDRSDTAINGEKYDYIGGSAVIETGKRVTVVQSINNSSKGEQQAEIQYDLYFYDSLNQKDRIDSKKQLINMTAGQSQKVAYIIPEMKESVYLLKITAQTRLQKSIVNIRFTSNQDHPIFNLPAITKFPLSKGDSETIFACFSNSSDQKSPEKKVNVVLTDKDGQEVGRLDYAGDIAGALTGAKEEVIAKADYDYLKLLAVIKDKDDKIIDQYETVYDCENINSEKCQQLFEKNIRYWNIAKVIVIYMTITIFLILVAFYIRKRWNSRNIYTFLFILISSFLFWGVKGTGAVIMSSSPGSSWTISSSGKVDYTAGVVQNSFCSDSLGQCTNYSLSATASYPRRLYWEEDVPIVLGKTFSPTTPALTPFTLTKSGNSVPSTYCTDVANLSTCNPINWLRDHTYVGTPSGTNPATFNLTFDSALLVKVSEIYATSDNPSVIQCTGQTCTAVGLGTAAVTYTLPGYSWRGASHVYGTGTVGGVQKNFDSQYINASGSGSAGNTTLQIGLGVIAGTALTVNKTGLGTGTVASSPSGISCGSTCSANFAGGTVTLTAIPDSGSALTSWTGCTVDPSDGNKCSVLMDQVRIVTATFDLNSPPGSPNIGRDPALVEEGTGNFVGEPGTSYSFSATSIDPDNDQIQYAFDWNNDNVADVWLPSLVTYVNSGASQISAKSWSEGFVKFKVKTCDKHFACSAWSSFGLTIGEKGICGTAAGNYIDSETVLRGNPVPDLCAKGTPSAYSPTLVSTYVSPNGSYAWGVQVVGNYAYVAYGNSGLEIVDISDPANPYRVGTTGSMGSTSWDLYVTDGYAYMANDDAGLKIVDVRDPENPHLVSTLDIAGDIHDVRASGDYIYLAYQHDGFKIVEATGDKTNPHVISSIPAVSNGSFDNANGMDLAGDYVYLAAKPGLNVINVSDPYAPVVTGSFDASFLVGDNPWPMDANIYGRYAFMVNIGYAMIDVSDPTMPHLYDEGGNWGIYDAGLYGWGMESVTVGDSGYIANANTDLGLRGPYEVFNPDTYYFSDPSYNPPGYDTANDAYGLDISGNYAYVAATGAGLKVFKLNTLSTAPDPGGEVSWTCSNTGGLEIDGKHSVSCKATKSAALPESYVCGNDSLCGFIECGDYSPVCVSSSGPPVFVDLSNCFGMDCQPFHCECPQDPTTTPPPGDRSWRESHPETN